MMRTFEWGLPYACPEELMWTPEELKNLPLCQFCAKKCESVFMRVFAENMLTESYCSHECFYNSYEVKYEEQPAVGSSEGGET